MIKEEYVTWDTAKLLKEAGFPQSASYVNVPAEYLANPIRPTQAQAMRWLRENLKIHIEIDYTKYNGWEYTLLLDYDTDKSRMGFSVGTDTYETAVENAIQAVCNYLIEKGGEQ